MSCFGAFNSCKDKSETQTEGIFGFLETLRHVLWNWWSNSKLQVIVGMQKKYVKDRPRKGLMTTSSYRQIAWIVNGNFNIVEEASLYQRSFGSVLIRETITK
ncbi:uncharacterized protein LOC114306439 isoform X2 [Camellia sinensis]|uniref:uncharacterized protein LOC114306439 isoform X2 n=1 Tax=Camellia sinensis TaxID=4442 RepID=UPI001035C319|nr:uncharacterized protein LOC114306439 isoform X2 [Camellia sinensis]